MSSQVSNLTLDSSASYWMGAILVSFLEAWAREQTRLAVKRQLSKSVFNPQAPKQVNKPTRATTKNALTSFVRESKSNCKSWLFMQWKGVSSIRSSGSDIKKKVWEKYLPTHFVVLIILLFFVLFSLEKAVTGTMYKLQFDFSFTAGQVTKCHIWHPWTCEWSAIMWLCGSYHL